MVLARLVSWGVCVAALLLIGVAAQNTRAQNAAPPGIEGLLTKVKAAEDITVDDWGRK